MFKRVSQTDDTLPSTNLFPNLLVSLVSLGWGRENFQINPPAESRKEDSIRLLLTKNRLCSFSCALPETWYLCFLYVALTVPAALADTRILPVLMIPKHLSGSGRCDVFFFF